MKKHNQLLSLLIFIFLLGSSQLSFSQTYKISGRIIDGNTEAGLDSVYLNFFIKEYKEWKWVETDPNGYFEFDSLVPGKHNLQIRRESYKTRHMLIEITDHSITEDVKIYRKGSPVDLAVEDLAFADIQHMGFAWTFYNPPHRSKSELFSSSVKFELFSAYKAKISNVNQVGIEISPLSLVWHQFDTDNQGGTELKENEKYFGAYFTLGVFHRLILSKRKKKGTLGSFLDLGIAYELPYLFRYSYLTGTNHKHLLKNIHKRNEFSTCLRLGFDIFSLKASYRLSNIMKAGYLSPPKLKIGVEFGFSSVTD